MLVCSAAPPSVPRPPAKKEKKNNLQFLLRRQKWKAKSGRSKQLMLRLKVPLHLKLTSLFQWGIRLQLCTFSASLTVNTLIPHKKPKIVDGSAVLWLEEQEENRFVVVR